MNPPEGAAAPANKKAAWFPVNGAEARIVITGFLLLFCVLGRLFLRAPGARDDRHDPGREATQNLWFFTALFAILDRAVLRLAGRARAARGAAAGHLRFMSLAFVGTALVFGVMRRIRGSRACSTSASAS